MKTRNTRNVESTFGTEFASNEFTVAVNGKTFDILLDQLYENKVRACIRELWTNAYDAHVAAGCEKEPFFCQLPTALDQTFSVRDYGISMSDDEVRHLYTTVFASTKTEGEDADDFVGSLGLGSKAPFAYTDAFTVIVWLDGEQRTYLCARGADGIPTITHLSTEASDQPRGVEVSFPVQAKHFRDFETEAHHVALGFDVKPTVPGITFKTDTAVFEGEGWRVVEGRDHGIRQGCVIYPLHEHHIKAIKFGFGLIVDVPIGTCDIAANREALSMDDVTRTNVQAAVTKAEGAFMGAIDDYLGDAPDAFTANERYVQLYDVFRLGKITYHGQPLTGTITFKQDDKQNTPQTVLDKKLKVAAGNLNFAVTEAKNYVFVIDRSDPPDTRPMPRKTTRFRAWRDGLPSRTKVLVLRDPTSRQLRHLVRRLHLAKDQLVSMRSLPDVKVERQARQASVNVGGVMQLNAEVKGFGKTKQLGAAAVKELPRDYLWIEITRWDGRDWDLGDLGRHPRGAARERLHKLMSLLDVKVPVLAMSPGAVKRFKPDQRDELVARSVAWVKANAQPVLIDYKRAKAISEVQMRAYHVTPKVMAAMLDGVLPAAAGESDYELVNLVERLLPKEVEQVRKEAKQIAGDLQKRYPLCFNASKENALLNYVAKM